MKRYLDTQHIHLQHPTICPTSSIFSATTVHKAGAVLQVKGEISGFLKMLGEVYTVFGLDYSLALSTRPEGYLGEIELWDQAEKALTESLNDSGACVSASDHHSIAYR